MKELEVIFHGELLGTLGSSSLEKRRLKDLITLQLPEEGKWRGRC